MTYQILSSLKVYIVDTLYYTIAIPSLLYRHLSYIINVLKEALVLYSFNNRITNK